MGNWCRGNCTKTGKKNETTGENSSNNFRCEVIHIYHNTNNDNRAEEVAPNNMNSGHHTSCFTPEAGLR